MNEWISVKDRLPEIDYKNKKSQAKVKIKINNNEDFCLNCNYRETFSASENVELVRRGYIFYTMDGTTYVPTHWMPLPEPPK